MGIEAFRMDRTKAVRLRGGDRAKDLKCDLFAECCSSNLFDTNALRLYLSTFTHVLYNHLRRVLCGLASSPMIETAEFRGTWPEYGEWLNRVQGSVDPSVGRAA